MANFKTTADYLDSILLLAGETTTGTSPYEARALYYLNQIHQAVISGGNEFNMEVDELWPWALEPNPINIELQPAYTTGTVSMTNGSTSGTFSDAPAVSLVGYHITMDGSEEVFKIGEHTAAATLFRLDSAYSSDTASASTYKALLLDYELISEIFIINSYNNKLVFTEATLGTELVATIVPNIYATAGTLAAQIKTQLDAVGASVYTVTYDSVTRKFNISSDLAGADNIFTILGATGTEANTYASVLPTLRMPNQDMSGASNYTSEAPLSGINKLVEPLEMHTGYSGTHKIYGVDKLRFTKEYPLSTLREGFPTRFTVIEERPDGYVKIRVNRYVKDDTRAEANYIAPPLTLYDATTSYPLIPAKYGRILEYGAAAYLLAEKNDNRATNYFTLASQLLDAMMKNNRKSGERVGENYGEVVAREDLTDRIRRRRLIYGVPE